MEIIIATRSTWRSLKMPQEWKVKGKERLKWQTVKPTVSKVVTSRQKVQHRSRDLLQKSSTHILSEHKIILNAPLQLRQFTHFSLVKFKKLKSKLRKGKIKVSSGRSTNRSGQVREKYNCTFSYFFANAPAAGDSNSSKSLFFLAKSVSTWCWSMQLAVAVAVHWRVTEAHAKNAKCTEECLQSCLSVKCKQCRSMGEVWRREIGRSYQRMDEWLAGADSKRCANWEISQVDRIRLW